MCRSGGKAVAWNMIVTKCSVTQRSRTRAQSIGCTVYFDCSFSSTWSCYARTPEKRKLGFGGLPAARKHFKLPKIGLEVLFAKVQCSGDPAVIRHRLFPKRRRASTPSEKSISVSKPHGISKSKSKRHTLSLHAKGLKWEGETRVG